MDRSPVRARVHRAGLPPLGFWGYAMLVAAFLIFNGAWINLLSLSYLGDVSVGHIVRMLGRLLNFDFSNRDSFAQRVWLHWAERARARSIFFLDKLARQEVYTTLRASTFMRTQYAELHD